MLGVKEFEKPINCDQTTDTTLQESNQEDSVESCKPLCLKKYKTGKLWKCSFMLNIIIAVLLAVIVALFIDTKLKNKKYKQDEKKYTEAIDNHFATFYEPSDAAERQERFLYGNLSLTTPQPLADAQGNNLLQKPSVEYYTCNEMMGEMDEYDEKLKYTIGELHACSQMNTWKWLRNECTGLDKCLHPRYMPGWENFDNIMKLHGCVRRLLVLLQYFKQWADANRSAENFKYHLSGGSMLGPVRHGDIIPHDDDGDVCVPNIQHTYFIGRHINEFPDDIGLYASHGDNYRLMDMNGKNYIDYSGKQEIKQGPYVDIFVPSAEDTTSSWWYLNYWNEEWNWEQDALPIQDLYLHGFIWPMPRNWAKTFAFLYKGRKAYTYVPYLGGNALGFTEYCSEDYDPKTDKQWAKDANGKQFHGVVAYEENGRRMLKRTNA